MMHPYHKYVVLFDRDLDFMVSESLEGNVLDSENFVKRIEFDITQLKKKNKLSEVELRENDLRIAKKILSESKHKLELWYSKQVTRITEEQKEALFDNKIVS
jgi:hypothetical protein